MRNRRIVASILALAMAAAACGGGSSDGDDASAPEPVDVETLALSGEGAAGLATFQAKCASCHRADLTGQTGLALGPGSKASAKPSADLRSTIVGGGNGMPAWGGLLSDAEIDGLIEFLLTAQGR